MFNAHTFFCLSNYAAFSKASQTLTSFCLHSSTAIRVRSFNIWPADSLLYSCSNVLKSLTQATNFSSHFEGAHIFNPSSDFVLHSTVLGPSVGTPKGALLGSCVTWKMGLVLLWRDVWVHSNWIETQSNHIAEGAFHLTLGTWSLST